jgi:pyrroline-5-carboxylate reductase
MKEQKILFIGAGRMAAAIAGGLVKNGFPAEQVKAFDISEQANEMFTKLVGAEAKATDLDLLVDESDIVVLAVKPQHIKDVFDKVKLEDKCLISIAAGVTLQTLLSLSDCKRVIRVMPNTPALVGAGAAAYAAAELVTKEDLEAVKYIFDVVGVSAQVPEYLLDASGSGPAYVFDFIQALSDGGVCMGLPRHIATQFAAQTVLGSAKMVLETGVHPSVLRDQVTSPGGTTARGLASLEQKGFRGVVSEAVMAATVRSIELGKQK